MKEVVKACVFILVAWIIGSLVDLITGSFLSSLVIGFPLTVVVRELFKVAIGSVVEMGVYKLLTDVSIMPNYSWRKVNLLLKKIHGKMITSFNINFTLVKEVELCGSSELFNELTKKTRNDLGKKGITFSDAEWQKNCNWLSAEYKRENFEPWGFYNPKRDTIYLNKKIMRNHKQLLYVCAHEMSEKLLFTIRISSKATIKNQVRAKPSLSIASLFKEIFREGCAEAIALETLHNLGYKAAVVRREKMLKRDYLKYICSLSDLSKTRRSTPKTLIATKNHAYCLAYPLAKRILESYGINGIKFALERPPLKAKDFVTPQEYLTNLRRGMTVSKQ